MNTAFCVVAAFQMEDRRCVKKDTGRGSRAWGVPVKMLSAQGAALHNLPIVQ